jgi:hypothetical protein
MPAITKEIVAYGQGLVIGCDAQCSKAWGFNHRPKVLLSSDVDDYEFLADHELAEAPIDPGTYEGEDGKPRTLGERLNKWCFRECERCTSAPAGEPLNFPNLLARKRNIQTP